MKELTYLKKIYKEALENNREVSHRFFNGEICSLNTRYLKYLIEYMESKQ